MPDNISDKDTVMITVARIDGKCQITIWDDLRAQKALAYIQLSKSRVDNVISQLIEVRDRLPDDPPPQPPELMFLTPDWGALLPVITSFDKPGESDDFTRRILERPVL